MTLYWRYAIPLLVLGLCGVAWLVQPWLLVVLGPATAITIFDFFQTNHTLRRNYPLIARIRWMMEDLRPFFQSYIVESDLEGRPFSHQQRTLVYARAKGDLDKHPMGTELDVYSNEYEWLSHSVVPYTDLPEQWRLAIGGPDCKHPYASSLLNISAMSFGSLSARAIEALNLGAKIGNFAHNTGEGSVSRYHRSHGGDLIWEIGSGYFGCRSDDGHFDPAKFADQAADDQVKMVEVKLSQGAKPGHGGVLPGEKVTAEIAEARGVPVGQTVYSPAAHSTFGTPIEMLEWIAELRRLSGGKPIGIKLCVGQPHEVMAMGKAMLATGIAPDFITVDGAEGGTGAAPLELSNSVGMPLREGTIWIRNMLVGTGLKDQVAIGMAGKIYSGAQMAKAFALGADWCNAARPFMFALGCVQSMQCHTDLCPTGVATQKAWRQRGLVVEDKGPRVARFHSQTLYSLREITIAMGCEDPWHIEARDMRERVNGVRSDAVATVYRFIEPGSLVNGEVDGNIGEAWRIARADSFRRAA